ncbi:type II secretion system protein N [Vibrio cyclitrophicus]|uniref:type II secretion system protein N n=1 Tax=Vibrio cyclitrophicus TaxID=47951 RepID=UPI0003072E15|nr:type II secretion system protein N [Vibrio cyclitrophicus]OED68517.1 general secretion pathway protein GspN [Vibrio cyclitrophicus ZF99]OEE00357.1 general secretion pathway protein GspN [Vibrio cyclitrophicus ZF28]OEF32377.1 general secretion pathway protein GspN [Vibrio cyclitrophicus 1F97]OEF44931.1 general secretion pathway protein GspN [Vibrio cyclitrophicus 1F273]OEF78413.1 general secretion pathway protein GspN [Vibrio cyclitrophicus 1F111]
MKRGLSFKYGLLFSSIFIVFFSVSLLLHLPASFALKQAPVVRGLNIEGVEGTVWQGSANNIVWQRINYGSVQWDFQFSKLLQAKAELAVRFGRNSDMNLSGKGRVGYSMSGAYAENLVASMPAMNVMKYAPVIPVPVAIGGQVELTIKHAVHAQPWCQSGEGTLAWSGAAVDSPVGALDLGPVIADISCEDSTIAAKGVQKSTQVDSEFSASLTPNQRYTSAAWFKPGVEFPPTMQNQLKWLGNPDNQGKYQFTYQGRF